METRIAKKSRFQIVKLEERVAPSVTATGNVTALAYSLTGVNQAASVTLYTQAYYTPSTGIYTAAAGATSGSSLS